MHDRIYTCPLKYAPNQVYVSNVSAVKGKLSSGQKFYPRERLRRTVREIIQNRDVVACFKAMQKDVRADVASPAGQQHAQGALLRIVLDSLDGAHHELVTEHTLERVPEEAP